MAFQKDNLKKFQKQLDGLNILEKIIIDILTEGIGSLVKDDEELFRHYAQIMSNYYLPKFAMIFSKFASNAYLLTESAASREKLLHQFLDELVVMQSSVNKIRFKLKDKLEKSDNTIDTELKDLTDGRRNRLRAKNDFKCDVSIFPLSFSFIYNPDKNCWFQRYYWIDLDSGSIYRTLEKIRKHPQKVPPKEPLFMKHQVSKLIYQPDVYDCLIRWENKEVEPLNSEDYLKLVAFADKDIPTAVSKMKSYIKNTLAEKCYPVILPVSRIGLVGSSFVLEDYHQHRMIIRTQNLIGTTNTSICHLLDLPYEYQERQSMFGMMFYDQSDFTICFHPHTLFTENKIYRLID